MNRSNPSKIDPYKKYIKPIAKPESKLELPLLVVVELRFLVPLTTPNPQPMIKNMNLNSTPEM